MDHERQSPVSDEAVREALSQLDALSVFAYRLSRDRQTSADLVQETMLRAWRSLHTYQPGSNCRAWLFQICKNIHINHHRRRQYTVVPVDLRDERGADIAGGRDRRSVVPPVAEDHNLWDEGGLSDEMVDALDHLPIEYRTAVLLSDVEGLPYDEIATFTRAPLGTVRSRIHRGRRLLAQRLSPRTRRNSNAVARRAA